MDKRKAQALRELQRRTRAERELDLDKVLFGKQLAFVKSSAKFKVAVCSRRAGKTTAAAVFLLRAAFRYPHCICPFVTLTRETARDLLWTPLLKLNREHNLGLVFKENTGAIHLPNGSKIVLRGAKTRAEMDKLRGLPYPAVFVDECQAFGEDFKYLMDEVLPYCLVDYDGVLAIGGTPNASCSGPFYEICEGNISGFEKFEWTIRENPHIPRVEAWIADYCKKKGWDENNPSYLRELCGRWVKDTNCLVFRFSDKTVIDKLPDGEWQWLLSCDLGYNDPCTFVVIAHNGTEAFVVDSTQENKLLSSEFAERVRDLCDEWPIEQIVCDTGGFGKSYAEELRRSFAIPVLAADKMKKLSYAEMVSDALYTGRARILESNSQLIHEARNLQWDSEALKRGKPKTAPGMMDHLSDALLYGIRECGILSVPAEPPPLKEEEDAKYWRDPEDVAREKMDAEPDWLEQVPAGWVH